MTHIELNNLQLGLLIQDIKKIVKKHLRRDSNPQSSAAEVRVRVPYSQIFREWRQSETRNIKIQSPLVVVLCVSIDLFIFKPRPLLYHLSYKATMVTARG